MFVRTLSAIVLLESHLLRSGKKGRASRIPTDPGIKEGDYVIHDYKLVSGESLPEVKLHYRSIGVPKQNAAGEVVNAVLLLQGRHRYRRQLVSADTG